VCGNASRSNWNLGAAERFLGVEARGSSAVIEPVNGASTHELIVNIRCFYARDFELSVAWGFVLVVASSAVADGALVIPHGDIALVISESTEERRFLGVRLLKFHPWSGLRRSPQSR
jgi:hypothetical protein